MDFMQDIIDPHQFNRHSTPQAKWSEFIMLDFSEAFGRMDHTILLEKVANVRLSIFWSGGSPPSSTPSTCCSVLVT